MPARTFQDRFTPEWPLFIAGRRVIIAALSVHVVLASISGYRAWVQVKGLELSADHPQSIRPGDWLHLSITTSGRVTNDVVLELIQADRREVLATRLMPMNRNFFYDPRSQHADVEVKISSRSLARFATGPAVVRATGYGGSQFLRIPPPVITDLPVVIR